MTTITPTQPAALAPASAPDRKAQIRSVAESFEASFIAESLKASGYAKSLSLDGKESEFSSFLIEEQARQIVKAGGFGIAEAVIRSLESKL